MSWLFPLYALGAMVIAAPILFHLFQRRPHGQQEFSSLMFLQATPPKLTRRSRLSDLLLLLLRAGVLLLLVAAFARPFLRSSSLLDMNAPARSVALLVDTSASMRRDGIWLQMQDAIDKVVKDLQPTDQVMLLHFDRDPETLISFEAWEETPASQRLAMLKQQIGALEPTWFATDFSAAMIEAGDALLQQRLVEDSKQPLHVVVFTDLQEGADLAGLQTYQWPKDVAVDVRTIAAANPTNASLQALRPEASEMDSTQVRILVRNEEGSKHGQFQLKWNMEEANGREAKPVEVYVPPGQTRVVRVTQPAGAVHLSLSGDDHDFDNELYMSETTSQKQKLWYFGDETDSDQRGLYFFLKQCSLDTRTREVTIERPEPQSLATVMPKQCPLVIVSKVLKDQSLEDLKRFANRGGRVLVVPGPETNKAAMAQFLSSLLGVSDISLADSAERDYSMLSKIDFQHPLFKPFADPRFNDFTKIKFWSHRRLSAGQEDPWTAVAHFDDDSPALIEKQIGDGLAWVLASGWQPNESSLALSSKFVPLLHGFFGDSSLAVRPAATWDVGKPISFSASQEPTTVISPGGEVFSLEPQSSEFKDATEPGIYTLNRAGEKMLLAVNLPNEESHTKAIMPDRLEQLGVTLGEQKSVEVMKTEQRLMRNKELESNQKLWRWGILAALLGVALETWMGGRAATPAPVGA